MPGDDVLQLLGGPQDRHSLNLASLSAGIIVEETHDRKAKLLVNVEPLDDLFSEITWRPSDYPDPDTTALLLEYLDDYLATLD